MSRITRLRRGCGAAGADRFAAEDSRHYTLAYANVYRSRRARSSDVWIPLATRMAGNDKAVSHLMDPITGFGDDRIVGGQEQSFPAFLDNVLQDLKGALGIRRIEVTGRFVR